MKKALIFALCIFLIILIVPTLSLSFIESNIENENQILDENNSYVITVYDVNTKSNFEIEMEDYLKGVVASEMPAEFDLEALKAQAVTARTYLIHHLKKYSSGHPDHTEASVCTGVHCQVWKSVETLKSIHASDWYDKYWPKIENAVDSTRGEILVYEGKIIEPLFHSTSGGRTENSEDVFVTAVPYLRSVESPYESEAPKLHSSIKISVKDFISTLNNSFKNINLTSGNLQEKITLAEISEGGKVKTVKIDNMEFSGRDIRKIFNLNSTNFRFIQTGDEIEILTTGYGHGVGMSQWGANGMAKKGNDYNEILKHYYTGIDIVNINK